MNMSESSPQSNNPFCDFITEDGYSFKCKHCEITVNSETYQEYPPIFLCRKPLDKSPQDDPISFAQKLTNFAKATAQHISKGMPMCNEQQILERHSICEGCEFFRDKTCTKCGCPISRDRLFASKLAWADQACPIGKWLPINTNPS